MARDENNGLEKEQSGPPPQSHDLRSGNVPPAEARTESVPPPAPPPVASEEDKDRFAKESFAHIRRSFEHALRDLSAQEPEIRTELMDVSDHEFTAKVHRHGSPDSACKIWLDGAHAIHYTGEGNPYQDVLTVDDTTGTDLRLRINDRSIAVEQRLVTMEQGAQHLWKQLTAPLKKG